MDEAYIHTTSRKERDIEQQQPSMGNYTSGSMICQDATEVSVSVLLHADQ
jgi:hypothetical protein